MEALVDALEQALPAEQRDEVYSTLVKALSNIVQNPTEQKFRNLRKDNKTVAERFARHPSVVSLLLALGFEDDGALYRLPPTSDLELVSEVVDLLQCIQASRAEAAVALAGTAAAGAAVAPRLPGVGKSPSPAASANNFARRVDVERLRDDQASQLEAVRAAQKAQHADAARGASSSPAGAAGARGAAASPSPSPDASPQAADSTPSDGKKKTPKSAFDFESRSKKEQESQRATQSLEELRRQQKEKYKEFQSDPDAHKSEAYKRPASVAGGSQEQSWGDWFSGLFGGGSSSSGGGGGGGGGRKPPDDRPKPRIKGISDLPKPVRRG